ncbi:MAG: ROK family protein, partial [Bacteroidales bacterium]|nr:ROK family protein [Bacteroidales bacterium]
GGTKIMIGIITPKGKILGKPYTVPTGGNDSEKVIINRIFNSIEKGLSNVQLEITDISGIGIGATGPLDMKKGLILDCPFLPSLKHFPLRKTIHEKFNVPVFLDNDANSFVLGECYFGTGRGHQIVLGYTLGTGLGCATVINKKIYIGATQHAGEVWPSSYRNKTIEDFVSGKGVSRTYQKFTGKRESAREIAQLAYNGDKLAKQTWEQFGENLAHAISWGINIIDPDIVILGGSIANVMDLFTPAMDQFLRKHICPVPAEKTKVVKAQLGDHAGFIGAACLVLQESNK